MSPPADVLDPRCDAVRAELLPWLELQRRLARDPARAARLLRRNGGPAAALVEGGGDGWQPGAAASDALEALRRCGAVALPLLSPAYPESLASLADPPPLLLVRGDAAALSGPAVAIVGARAATSYGLGVAREFAGELARAGLAVVSGLAWGVDAAAHRGALEVGGRTVAVQACGPDQVYPRAHRGLSERIADRGAVVTEFPPGTPSLPAHFPLRNRLISALAAAVVVVEARVRSGSLITARHAADQGVDVFAVPGPITAPTSEGTNALLRDGAWAALEPADVLSVLGVSAASPAERRARAGRAPRSAESRRILAVLSHAPASPDELARRLGSAPERLALDLLELELEGAVARDRDGRLRVR